MSTRPGRWSITLVVVLAAVAVASSAVARNALASRVAQSPAPPMPICYHIEPSEYICPDTSRFVVTSREVMAVEMTVVLRSGRRITHRIGDGKRPVPVDAIFLSRDAVQDFLLPYYDRANQPRAANLRTVLRNRAP